MGTITVNVKDDIEKEFRDTVKKQIGEGKGKLGEAITLAMKNWSDEMKQRVIAEEMKALMKKGFNMGNLKIKSRDELYDRKY